MTISKQDRSLATAAVALYRAAEFGCVPDNRDTDEAGVDDCIETVRGYMESFHYCGVDDMQALTDCVYTKLSLGHNKIH